MADAATYRSLAERAWRWVLEQVRWDDGPWIPEAVKEDEDPTVPEYRDGMHSGIGGLAHVLAEVRLSRPWTAEEAELADAVAERLRREIPTSVDVTYFDGLVSTLGALTALGAPGADDVVARLTTLAADDGWPQTAFDKFGPDARINDLTLGSAGVVLAGLWADGHGVDGGQSLAEHAAEVVLAEGEPTATGTFWRFVPARFRDGGEMPNLSHGLAGIALALALAGERLDRRDLVDAAVSGAEHLVSLGEVRGDGFVVSRYLPPDLTGEDEVTYTWCHGAAGTSLLFRALDHVGVDAVAGEHPSTWWRRCLHSVRTSGLPERRTRASGTTTAAAAVRRGWGRSSSMRGSSAIGRRPGLRAHLRGRPRRASGDGRTARLLAVRGAPSRRPAAAARGRLDAGRRRHRGVPLPHRPARRAGRAGRASAAHGQLVGRRRGLSRPLVRLGA